MVSFDVTLLAEVQRLFELLFDFRQRTTHALTLEFVSYAH
jgi:hypothetical protein